MSDFQVNPRRKQEPTGALFGRVLVSFILFIGGLVLIGAGASHESALAPALFVGGILAVGLGYLLPMIGAHER